MTSMFPTPVPATPVAAAKAALARFHVAAEPPIDPIVIARDLGINVWKSPMESSLAGMLAKLEAGSDADIDLVINASHNSVRQRFTAAHELGHYFNQLRTDPTLEKPFLFKRDDRSSCGVHADEIFANQFAAALLMPAPLVRTRAEADRDVVSLADEFDVSAQAMGFRLANLGL